MFCEHRFFRAVEAASILLFHDHRAVGSLGLPDVHLPTAACDPVHHVDLLCVRKLVFYFGQRLSGSSLWGECSSDVKISGKSLDVFAQSCDIRDAHGWYWWLLVPWW